MTNDLLLDTHILLWLVESNPRLRPSTRALIERRWRAGGTILISAVSGWEIGALVQRRRVTLDLPLDAWFDDILSLAGYMAAPLRHDVAARAYMLSDLAHGDPADRMLIATAIDLGCPLITYDERIIAFATSHGSRYGFTVES